MAYRAGGDILVRWTHVDIECVRLHVWSWLVDDFGQSLWPKSFSTSHDHSSIQAGPLVGNTWRLALNESLKQWEFGGEQAQVLATSVTVILPAALCVSPAEAAFRMTSSHWMGLQKPQGLMKHLPCCALCPHTLTFWSALRSGTSSCEATRRPAKIDLWRLSQSLSFWDTSRIRAWTIWHGQQALNEWLVKQFPHETSRCPQQRLWPWRLVFVQFPSIYYRLWLWHTKSEATKSGWKLHK